MPETSKRANLIVIVSAVAIVICASLLTLYVSGVIFPSDSDANESGYKNVTFNDAVMTCHKHTRGVYGEKVRTLVTDNHSSRFSEKSYLYKIFLKLDLYNSKKTSGQQHFVNCFVRAKNGRISKYEVFEDKEGATSPTYDDGTNIFGIKKRN